MLECIGLRLLGKHKIQNWGKILDNISTAVMNDLGLTSDCLFNTWALVLSSLKWG